MYIDTHGTKKKVIGIGNIMGSALAPTCIQTVVPNNKKNHKKATNDQRHL